MIKQMVAEQIGKGPYRTRMQATTWVLPEHVAFREYWVCIQHLASIQHIFDIFIYVKLKSPPILQKGSDVHILDPT